MGIVWTIVVLGFVVAVLGLVGWSLYEVSPLCRHADHYRDATGKRVAHAPNLEEH